MVKILNFNISVTNERIVCVKLYIHLHECAINAKHYFYESWTYFENYLLFLEFHLQLGKIIYY